MASIVLRNIRRHHTGLERPQREHGLHRRFVILPALTRGPWAALLVATLTGFSLPALAQDPPRGRTPFERSRPELAPIGLRLGSFRAFPQAELSEEYDSNVFAVADNPEGDFVSTAEASLAVRSDWNNHALGGRAYGRLYRYAENSGEDREEGGVSIFGELDVTRANALAGTVAYRRETASRTDPEEDFGGQLSELDRYVAQFSYRHRISRFGLVINSQVQRLDFVTAPDQFRDRNELRLAPRLYYDVSPAFRPFVEVAYQLVEYDTLSRDGTDRDSDTVGGYMGTAIELSGILEAEVFAGFFNTDFDDPGLDSQSSLGGGASLVWLVTDLTALIGEASRGVEQTTRASASNKIRSLARLRVEHELRRNVLLDGEFQVTREEFEGIDRLDSTLGISFGAEYRLNRNLSFSLGYSYLQRESDVAGADFAKNVVFLSSTLRF